MASLDEYLGPYRFSNGQLLIVARSERRLYCYEEATRHIRGLEARAADAFYAGPSVLQFEPITLEFEFERAASGHVQSVTVRGNGQTQRAERASLYTEEPVRFMSGAGQLAGTFLRPHGPGPHPAAILVHGSGPQDRNGYMGLMRLAADHLARHGIAALIYDKRGVNESAGEWATASFAELAQDAIAVREFLQKQPGIQPNKIGLWGSSQAGWVMAHAVTQQPGFAFVIAVSAGGSGYSAARQNRYNLLTEMRATGTFSEEQINLTMAALDEFYAVLRRGPQSQAPTYAHLWAQASQNPALVDWLPPPLEDIHWQAKDQWFLALEIDFDPLPAWANYGGPVLGIFGALDSSTPVAEVVPLFEAALASRPHAHHTIHVFPQAHHLLLEARTGSDAELETLTRYVAGYFTLMTDWLWQVL